MAGKSQKTALDIIARYRRGEKLIHIPELDITEVKSSTLRFLYNALQYNITYIETAKRSVVNELSSRAK